jgi:hypothetical protein
MAEIQPQNSPKNPAPKLASWIAISLIIGGIIICIWPVDCTGAIIVCGNEIVQTILGTIMVVLGAVLLLLLAILY